MANDTPEKEQIEEPLNEDVGLPPEATSYLSPDSLIEAARNAHPAFKYAIVVAGLAALVATVVSFGLNYATLVFGIIILIGFMVLFVIFAQVARLGATTLDLPAKLFVWLILLVVATIVLLLTSSAFFNWPLPIRDAIIRSIDPDCCGTPPNAEETDTHPVEETEEPTPEPDQEAVDFITQDLREAYTQAGRQVAVFNDWGKPPALRTFRVSDKSLYVTFGNRTVSMSIDPDGLPESQFLNSEMIAAIGSANGTKVTSFVASYGRYKASLKTLSNSPSDVLAAFGTANSDGNEMMRRGRIALCALGETPPRLFPDGGPPEPQPINCDGLSI